MFIKRDPIDTSINAEIKSLLKLMEKTRDKTGDTYADLLQTMTKLHELREKNRVSKDTLWTIAANVAGLVLVIRHEHVNVITTKALSLVKKLV